MSRLWNSAFRAIRWGTRRRQAIDYLLAPRSFRWSVNMDYDKFQIMAQRDWLAGKNLEEAAKIMYGTTDPEGLQRMVKLRREELAPLGKRGQAAIRVDMDYDRLKLLTKATADWAAGRNLEEAVKIMYGTTDPEFIKRILEVRSKQTAARKKGIPPVERKRGKSGKSIDVEGLGKLKHDGDEFVVKKKMLLYPKYGNCL